MRLTHPDGTTVHLAYCANAHPAAALGEVRARLADHAAAVRRELGADRLGIGLWLPRAVATRLRTIPADLAALRADLDDNGLEVVTLNGFPYQGFGDDVVKTRVYVPDWAQRARLEYTLDLAWLLAALLPADIARGSISTLPLGWHAWWSPEDGARAGRNLSRLADGLATVEAETGKEIRIGFEPEPGCVVETTADAATVLPRILSSAVHPAHRHRFGVCLDACHLAVGFEDPAAALATLAAADLPVVKAQASAALHCDTPADPAHLAALERYAEPRYLHQTRARHPDGTLHASDDLPLALDDAPRDRPWRVHFHMPLHADAEPPLRTTRPELTDTLQRLLGGPTALTDHVEVETYTWWILPDGSGLGTDRLVAGLAAELDWARGTLAALGCKEAAR
ncbi:xylose isomerase-like TIM barrel protein [Murinocardiopsis flavida]|uniref:Xylose isomerase-like TIM barrel protein n=1 Tax=Murinocardiopsis flavida TaxID=645275 RepID=A0A2P8DLF2_9ACTN|nr:metabolite traffic protein EboE [Murinocardiopsis flavida]PSK98053.1 xylose isomerase-like TIM barrel protein [Murinocardiopsis flavida]